MDDVKNPRTGRPKGMPKTGGRKQGTPNKATKAFKEVLDTKRFSIAEEALKMFEATTNEALKLKILMFLADYSHSRPKPIEEPSDNKPETLDEDLQSESIESLFKAVK